MASVSLRQDPVISQDIHKWGHPTVQFLYQGKRAARFFIPRMALPPAMFSAGSAADPLALEVSSWGKAVQGQPPAS